MTMSPEAEKLLAEFKARRTPGTPEREAWLARRKESRAIALRNGGISVNGRIRFFNRITSVKRVPGSKFRWVSSPRLARSRSRVVATPAAGAATGSSTVSAASRSMASR